MTAGQWPQQIILSVFSVVPPRGTPIHLQNEQSELSEWYANYYYYYY